MKKLLSAILSLALAIALILSLSLTAFAEESKDVSDNIDIAEAYALAERLLTDYYRAIDLYEYYDYSKYISTDTFLAYVISRVDCETHAGKLLVGNKYRYELTVRQISCERLSDCLRLHMSATAKYFYSEDDSEPASYSEDSYLLISTGEYGLEICDWYFPHDPYDEATRGEVSEISDKDFWKSDPAVPDILEKQKKWNERITERAEADSAPAIDYSSAVDSAYALAESFLREYYPALHTSAEYDLSPYIAPDPLLVYTNGRIESTRSSEKLILAPQRLEYQLETELKESENLGDCIRLYVAVRASWRYSDASFRSGLGDGVYLLIADSGDGLKIYDWYIPHDPYLEYTRGNLTTIYNKDFWESSPTVSEILERQKEWDSESVERSDEILAQSHKTHELDDEVGKAYKFAEEFLGDFYNGAHYISDECDLSKYISNADFLEYMTGIYQDEGSIFKPGSVSEHSVSFELHNFKPIKDCVWLEIVSDLKFRFNYSDKTSHSIDTIELIVGFEDGSCVLKDYYNPYWHRGTRPGVIHAYDPDFWDDPEKSGALLALQKERAEAKKKTQAEIDARSSESANMSESNRTTESADRAKTRKSLKIYVPVLLE